MSYYCESCKRKLEDQFRRVCPECYQDDLERQEREAPRA